MQKILVILPLFATACGGSFEPMSGNYNVEMTVMDDGCGFDDTTTDTGEMSENITSVQISDDGMMVTLDETTECDLDGVSFVCSETSETFDASTVDETLSAVFSSTMETNMEWTAADMIDGEVSFGFSCEGADCETVAVDFSMPADCTSVWSVALTLVEDTAATGTE